MNIFRRRPDAPEKRDKLEAHVENRVVLVSGAAKDHWILRALIPTVIGLIVIARYHFWPILKEYEKDWREIITHLGIAFLVSGIVVFGYEWGSDRKKMGALTAKLLNYLSRNVDRVLEASDRIAVRNALENLAGKKGELFADSFLSLAKSIERLGRVGWTADSYLKFLSHYLKELTDKASGLADMSEKLQSSPVVSGTEYHLLMPDASKLIDVLVEAIMRELAAHGGEYYAVSDVSTWDKLGEFNKAHAESLAGQLHIKRIFVLGRESDDALPPARVNDILNDHFKQARAKSNRYEMKITSLEEYRCLRIPDLTDPVHFGIWAPKDGAPVAVLAIDDNFSNFRLAPVPREMINDFKTLWSRLDDLTDRPLGPLSKVPAGGAIIQDYMLAYYVGRMGQGKQYRGISKMAMWRDGGLKHFFEASINAIHSKQISVKRVFVFDKPEKDEDRHVLDVIRSHAAVAKTNHYEWRVCLRRNLPPQLTPPGIAIFEGLANSAGQVLSEVAVGAGQDSPPRVETQPRIYEAYVQSFDDFWSKLKLDDGIRDVFGQHAHKVLEIIDDPSKH